MIIQIKPYQLFAKKKSFLIVFCSGIVFFIVGLACITVYILEYYKRLEKQNNDASQQVNSIEVFEKPTVDFIIVSGVFSLLFLICNFVLFIMYKNIFRLQKSWVLLLLLILFIMAFGLLLLNIAYVAKIPPSCPTLYTLSDDGSSCTISNYKPPSGGGTFNSLKFWNGNSYASWDVSDDEQKVSLNFTKENQDPINGYFQVSNEGSIPDILQIYPLPTYNGTEKLYFAYRYQDDDKKIVNTKYDWEDCVLLPEEYYYGNYNICTVPRDDSFNQMTEISDSENNQPSSLPDKISSIFFKNGIKMYIGKDNNFYILGDTACVKIYLDIYIDPTDALCKNGLVNIDRYSCDGMGGISEYTQDKLLSGISIADLSTADNPPTKNDTSIQYNNCSIGYITASFEEYNEGELFYDDQLTINDTRKDTFIVSDPSDTYEPIQNFESVEFGSCQISQQDDTSIELKLGLTFLKFYLNDAQEDLLVVGTEDKGNNLTYGTTNGWKTT